MVRLQKDYNKEGVVKKITQWEVEGDKEEER